MLSPRQAADAGVGRLFCAVVAADQGCHIGGIHIVRPGIAMQGVGFRPAAHHLGAHRKQGLAMEGIRSVKPRGQRLGIGAGQVQGHGCGWGSELGEGRTSARAEPRGVKPAGLRISEPGMGHLAAITELAHA